MRVAPHLVRGLTSFLLTGRDWHRLVREENNIHRYRRHCFSSITADRLRLRVMAVHGGTEGAHVYAIRVPVRMDAREAEGVVDGTGSLAASPALLVGTSSTKTGTFSSSEVVKA